jgi:hypothetical protein
MIIVKPYPHPDDWMKEDPENPQEMASSPDDIRKDLTQYGGALVEHLFKLFYFREFEEYFKNWSNSVYKCAFHVLKLNSPPKLKNKLPPADMIYEWMWGRWEDSLDTEHNGFLRNVNNKNNPEYQHLPYIHVGGDEKSAGSIFSIRISRFLVDLCLFRRNFIIALSDLPLSCLVVTAVDVVVAASRFVLYRG